MSGDIIRFPGRTRAVPGQGNAERDDAERDDAEKDVGDLIREILQVAPVGDVRIEPIIDPEIGSTLVDAEEARPVIADLLDSLIPLLDPSQPFRIRASSVYQPELPGSKYLGLAEGQYVLILFDGLAALTPSAKLPTRPLSTLEPLRARVAAIHGHLAGSMPSVNDLSVALYLPLRAERGDGEQNAATDPASSKLTHVLLVDDNEQVQSSVSAMLRVLGYRVTMRSGGAEALDTLRRNPSDFQVVLSDLTMPRVSGIELVARIKSIRPDLPVVLMTGFSIESAASQAPGITDMLQKPFALAELRRVMSKAVLTEK